MLLKCGRHRLVALTSIITMKELLSCILVCCAEIPIDRKDISERIIDEKLMLIFNRQWTLSFGYLRVHFYHGVESCQKLL